MQNILKMVLGLGALAAVHAVPVTFTDVVGGSENILSQGQTYSFTHNINDNGFNSGTDAITSADIYISLFDDLDNAAEKVKIKFDNLTIENNMEVDYAAYHFLVASSMLQSDGLLNVSLNVVAGDFYFFGSRLEVDANRTAPAAVPEPTTFAMLGMGLLGLGLVARRKRA
jgi:uncharacterized protein with beta-barrel porin domain